MYLKHCEIKNFRSIKHLQISFENSFQILVGLNEAGKSNILKALSFMEASMEPEDDDIRDPRHDEEPVKSAYIWFVFGLEKKESEQVFNDVKAKFKAKDMSRPLIQIGSDNYSLQEFCDYKKEGLYVVNLLEKTKSASNWKLHGSHYAPSKAWAKVPKNWPQYKDFDNPNFEYICIEDYPEYKDDTTLEDVSIGDLNSAIGTAIINIVDDSIFDCVVWRYNENNLLPGRIDISTFSDNPDTCEPLRNIFYLAGYDDIPKTLSDAQLKTNGMRNLLRKLSDNTTQHLRKVWPEYKNISIDLTQNGGVIEAGIEDEFNVYSLDRRSDGFKRFVTFLLMISAKAKAEYLYDTLIIVDEPDIGLHPSGVQFLREELKKIAKDNLVVIATHSIFMIDKDRIDRHLIIKKEKEETTLTSDYSSRMLDEEVIYKALGYSLFDLLKRKNVVFEGWSDKHTFQQWIQSSTNKIIKESWKDIGMVHALGAKDVCRVTAHLEDFDRQYIVLSDSDKPSLDWKNKFEGKHPWLTYKDLGFEDKETIEDFLNQDYVLNQIKKVLQREQVHAKINFEDCTTFNAKIEKLRNTINIGKDEFGRLKKLIKNSIFDDLPPNKIAINKQYK